MAGDLSFPDARRPDIEPAESVEELLPVLRHVARRPGMAGTFYCETGYGMVGYGDKVLIGVNNFHNELVVDGVRQVLEEKGAKVDVVTFDQGEDRERTGADEVKTAITGLEQSGLEDTDMKLGVFQDKYGEFLGQFYSLEDMAEREGYDLLIQSYAGPFEVTPHDEGDPYNYERIPWQSTETLKSAATTFPRDVYTKINEVTYNKIWNDANKGAEVRLTDPEGTDLTYTLLDEYIEGAGRWEYLKGHIGVHPFPPVAPSENADIEGVIAGTLGHYNGPFPQMKMHVTEGRVTDVEGGGEYGDQVRTLHEYTADLNYPDFPGPGIFWPNEFAIGTQPKAFRPPENFLRRSGTGTLAERLRSGVIHIGIGTIPLGENEPWAQENGHLYGHIHLHLYLPTLEIHRPDGEVISVIEKGRLTALDNPEVRDLAAEHGDPEELLREDWVPSLPGITADGSYEEYAKDPLAHIRTVG